MLVLGLFALWLVVLPMIFLAVGLDVAWYGWIAWGILGALILRAIERKYGPPPDIS